MAIKETNYSHMKEQSLELITELNTDVKKNQMDIPHHPFRDISIWLDSYDDIFSDFDPREYSERNISDDFLYELKKVCQENKSTINKLKLLVPEKGRNTEKENLIIKRLHSHLKKNYHDFRELQKNKKRNGLLFALAGVVLMITASYISLQKSENFVIHTILVILEPAGWFILWTGLDDLKKSVRSQKAELDLFIKMAKSSIVFISI